MQDGTAAVVIPILTPRGHDNLVRAHLTGPPVVTLASGTAQRRVYPRQRGEHFSFTAEEVAFGDLTRRCLGEVRAALNGHQQQRAQRYRTERRCHEQSLHMTDLLKRRDGYRR